ncbi:MAG TPA: signal peptidase I [Candidatus Saccharimonadales bacterium]|nr:signal peptidase I [Candidatus Saccharimonadales bacterium]
MTEESGRAGEAALHEWEAPPKGIIRDYFETIVICVIFVVAARAFVFQQSKIPTGSMIPTLLVGDYIVVNKFIYAPTATALERAILPVREVRRGDIVVFKYPVEPEKDYIKRIIGMPGDVLEVRNKTVYINGEPLDEPYKVHETEMTQETWRLVKEGEMSPAAAEDASPPNRMLSHFRGDEHFNFGPFLVPPDSYFAMGDNRDNSKDSRAWGTVPRENIKGRAFVIFWSFSGEEGDHTRTGLIERTKSIANKVFHFLTKSRYRRVFQLIR